MPTIDEMRVVLAADIGAMQRNMAEAATAVGKFEQQASDKLQKFDSAMAKTASKSAEFAKGMFSPEGRSRLLKYMADAEKAVTGESKLIEAQETLGKLKEILTEFKSEAKGGVMATIVGLYDAVVKVFDLVGEKIPASTDGVVNLKQWFQATAAVVGGELSTALDTVKGQLVSMKDKLAVGDTIEAEGAAIVETFNKVAAVIKETTEAIVAVMRTVPGVIGEAFISAANAAIRAVEWMTQTIIDALNKIPGIDIKTKVELPRLDNVFDGKMGEAKEAFRKLGETTAGEWAKGVVEKINEKAREIAGAKKDEEKKAEPDKGGAKIGDWKTTVDAEPLRELTAALNKLDDLHRKAAESMDKYAEGVRIEAEKEARTFETLYYRKLITAQEFEQARADIAIVASRKILEAVEKENKRLREAFDAVAGEMSSAFDTFMRTGKFSFKDFASSVISDIMRIYFKMLILEPLFGGSGRGFGMLGSLLGLPSSSIPAGGMLASGGPARPGIPYIVGERGPELFIPGEAGSVVPANRTAAAARAALGDPMADLADVMQHPQGGPDLSRLLGLRFDRRSMTPAEAARLIDLGTGDLSAPRRRMLAGRFGGYRAAGGPVSAGTAYVVGEHGPETFVPSGSRGVPPVAINVAVALPREALQSAMAASRERHGDAPAPSVHIETSINIEGNATSETVDRLRSEISAQLRPMVQRELVETINRKQRFTRAGL